MEYLYWLAGTRGTEHNLTPYALNFQLLKVLSAKYQINMNI